MVTYNEQQQFPLSKVFNEGCAQETVYHDVAAPLVNDFFKGYNCCIFAYGQTGTGKSYTMMGGNNYQSRGIIPRILEAVCGRLESNLPEGSRRRLSVSFVQVYREKLTDLLNPHSSTPLSIRTVGGVSIEGAVTVEVKDEESIMNLIEEGNANRMVSKTNMNSQSSRSHSILQISMTQVDADMHKTTAKMTLVDLAGSERIVRTGAKGATQKEGSAINVSLTTLGKVIKSIAERKSHVPFRESKLTLLLSETINGNCKLCVIMTASRASADVEETLSTLRFGRCASTIKNKVVTNRVLDPRAYKRMFLQQKAQNEELSRRCSVALFELQRALQDSSTQSISSAIMQRLRLAATTLQISLGDTDEYKEVARERAQSGDDIKLYGQNCANLTEIEEQKGGCSPPIAIPEEISAMIKKGQDGDKPVDPAVFSTFCLDGGILGKRHTGRLSIVA